MPQGQIDDPDSQPLPIRYNVVNCSDHIAGVANTCLVENLVADEMRLGSRALKAAGRQIAGAANQPCDVSSVTIVVKGCRRDSAAREVIEGDYPACFDVFGQLYPRVD